MNSYYNIIENKRKSYERIFYLINLLQNSFEKRAGAHFNTSKISLQKYKVLAELAYTNDGQGLNQIELGKRLLTTPANVTKIIDSLYADKFITRVQNKDNRRENIIRITHLGFDLLEELHPEYDRISEEFTDLLPEPKRKLLIETLRAWVTALEKLPKS